MTGALQVIEVMDLEYSACDCGNRCNFNMQVCSCLLGSDQLMNKRLPHNSTLVIIRRANAITRKCITFNTILVFEILLNRNCKRKELESTMPIILKELTQEIYLITGMYSIYIYIFN